MRISHNDIDNLFYDGIEKHTELPSGKVWDKLKAELDRNEADLYKRKYTTVKRYAVVLSLLLIAILVYEVANFGEPETNISQVNTVIAQPVPATVPVQTNNNSNPRLNEDVYLQEGQREVQYSQVNAIRNIAETKYEPGKTHINTAFSLHDPVAITATEEIEELNALTKQDEYFMAATEVATTQINTNNEESNNRRMRFFDLVYVDDARTNTIRNGLQISLFNPLPLIHASRKEVSNDFRNSRVSAAVRFSPTVAYNSIKDDKSHRDRRGGGNNGGGNNNGGNNGGGNNNGGNNNGGNNGGGRGGRDEDRHDYLKNEQSNLAWSGGFAISYKLTKKLSAETGITYLTTSTTSQSKKIYAVRDNNGTVNYKLNSSSGFCYVKPHTASSPNAGDSTVISQSKNSLSYVGIPLSVSYKLFTAGRVTVSAAAGGQVNFLTKGKTTVDFGSHYHESAQTMGLKPVYFSLLTSIVGEMSLTKRVSLILAPTGQFGQTYINKGSSVKTKPNYLGLSAGLKLKL
jgi:hypothetical protein